jgi:hypothetical protein
MPWIRNPWWDGIWILSGVPIGIGMAVCHTSLATLMALFFAINIPHLISPIALVWTHRTFRPVALRRWKRYIAVPIGVMLLATVIAFVTEGPLQINHITLQVRMSNIPSPHQWTLLAWLGLYFVWNAYHFGSQNFGILRLYGVKGRKILVKWGCVALTVLGFIVIPRAIGTFAPTDSSLLVVPMVLLGTFSFNHSLAALGLSAHVWSRHHGLSPWIFVAGLFAASAPFVWLLIHHDIVTSFRLMILLITVRIGLGFVHFIYDGGVWKLSDPQVRATIGRDLLEQT